QEAAKPLRPAQSHVAQDTSGMWLFLTEPSAQLSSTPGGWLIPSQRLQRMAKSLWLGWRRAEAKRPEKRKGPGSGL
ncbi:mCG1042156, partial [Mus musculus]